MLGVSGHVGSCVPFEVWHIFKPLAVAFSDGSCLIFKLEKWWNICNIFGDFDTGRVPRKKTIEGIAFYCSQDVVALSSTTRGINKRESGNSDTSLSFET
jgi:hypothetical protein